MINIPPIKNGDDLGMVQMALGFPHRSYLQVIQPFAMEAMHGSFTVDKNDDLPIQTDDVPVRYVKLPEDNYRDNPFTGNENDSIW